MSAILPDIMLRRGFKLQSKNEGVSFSRPARLAITGDGVSVAMPSVAVKPDGGVLACWSEELKTEEHGNQVRCAAKVAGRGWTASTQPVLGRQSSITVFPRSRHSRPFRGVING